jgi:hypothetical protein
MTTGEDRNRGTPLLRTCSEIITHELALDEINMALDLVRSGTAGRVLLNVFGSDAA